MTRAHRLNLLKGLAFISPWLGGFLAFTALPVAMSAWYSLCDVSLIHQPPVYVGAQNYVALAHDPVFWKTLENSFYYAALSLPAGLILALALALLLNANVPGQAIYRTILFLPSLVPTVAAAVLWVWLYERRLGLINYLLSKLGLSGPGWLTDVHWAMPALVIVSLWSCGNTVIIYLAGLQDVPRELYEAAHLDGAGPWRRLWNVTLPMLSPVIFFNLIMAIIGIFQIFGTPFVMTGGEPERSTYFYTMYLYDQAFTFLRLGVASAMAWIQLLIILALTALAFWSSKRWVYYQSK
jgi:multiple sugar transport system permease protein